MLLIKNRVCNDSIACYHRYSYTYHISFIHYYILLLVNNQIHVFHMLRMTSIIIQSEPSIQNYPIITGYICCCITWRALLTNQNHACISVSSACDCDVVGSATMQCDRRTGSCECLAGVGGHKCDRCARGTTGQMPYCVPCGECFDDWDRIIQELSSKFIDKLLTGCAQSLEKTNWILRL